MISVGWVYPVLLRVLHLGGQVHLHGRPLCPAGGEGQGGRNQGELFMGQHRHVCVMNLNIIKKKIPHTGVTKSLDLCGK